MSSNFKLMSGSGLNDSILNYPVFYENLLSYLQYKPYSSEFIQNDFTFADFLEVISYLFTLDISMLTYTQVNIMFEFFTYYEIFYNLLALKHYNFALGKKMGIGSVPGKWNWHWFWSPQNNTSLKIFESEYKQMLMYIFGIYYKILKLISLHILGNTNTNTDLFRNVKKRQKLEQEQTKKMTISILKFEISLSNKKKEHVQI